MKLTQRRIDELECPAGKKDALVSTASSAGLAFASRKAGGRPIWRSTPLPVRSGAFPLGRVQRFRSRRHGRPMQAILGDVAKGRDPAAERKQTAREAKEKAEADALTLGALIDKWEAGHLAGRRPGYATEATRALRFAFKKHLASPAAGLTPKAVKTILNATVDDGKKATARLTGAYGRACYGWAISKDLLAENPFAGIKLSAVASRERVLSENELKAIWGATKGPGAYNAIVRMSILTGQRREEVAGMTWDEIASDLSTWTIPANRAKNGLAHIVPLSLPAQAIIKSAHRMANDDADKPEFVFQGRAAAFNGFSKAKLTLDEDSGVKNWRLHATFAERWRPAFSG